MNIYEKLAEARKIIRNTKAKKEGKNAYSDYDYFTPEQVEALVAEACEKVKALCITNLKQDQFGYFQTLEFVDIEGGVSGNAPIGNSLSFELRTEKPEIKATNATQQMGGMDTYSERYIKMKVFQIKDNNLDFDSQDNRKVYASKPHSPDQYQGSDKLKAPGAPRFQVIDKKGKVIDDFGQEELPKL